MSLRARAGGGRARRRTHTGARGDVARVDGDAVRDVQHGRRRLGQATPLVEAQRRPDVAPLPERGTGCAERAADDEHVAGPRAGTTGHARGATERGDRENEPRPRPRCRRRRPARPSRPCPRTARARPRPPVVPGARERDERAPPASAPEAARSLRLTAAARQPRSRHEIQSRRKWTSSTSASCVATSPSSSCAASCSIARARPRRSSSARSPRSPTSESRIDSAADGRISRGADDGDAGGARADAVGRVGRVDAADRHDGDRDGGANLAKVVEPDRQVGVGL